MTRKLSGAEAELALAYLDGRLEEHEACELEARLAAEPDLAQAFEELRATDTLLRAAGQRGLLSEVPPAAASGRRRVRWSLAAAAGLAAALFLIDLLRSPEPPPVRWGVVASAGTADAWRAERSPVRELVPPLREEPLRGGDPPRSPATTAPAVDFAERAAAVHDGEVERALEARSSPRALEHFRLALELHAPRTVVVLAATHDGAVVRLFPPADAPPGAARLAAGRHTLPEPPFVPAGNGALAYRPGWPVPLGSGGATLLVASSTSETVPWSGLDDLLREAAPLSPEEARARLRAGLEGLGFAVSERDVLEAVSGR